MWKTFDNKLNWSDHMYRHNTKALYCCKFPKLILHLHIEDGIFLVRHFLKHSSEFLPSYDILTDCSVIQNKLISRICGRINQKWQLHSGEHSCQNFSLIIRLSPNISEKVNNTHYKCIYLLNIYMVDSHETWANCEKKNYFLWYFLCIHKQKVHLKNVVP